MGYAIRITTRAVEVVSGADSKPGIVAAEATGVKVGLRAKWGGSELRSRTQSGRMVRQGNGWVLEGSTNPPYASYAPTPVTGAFAPPASPYLQSAGPSTAPPHSAVGMGFPSSTFGPGPAPGTPGVNGHGGHLRTPSLLGGPPRTPRTPYTSSLQANGGTPPPPPGGAGELPGTPSYALFPPTPNPANGNGNGHGGFAEQQATSGVLKDAKKDD